MMITIMYIAFFSTITLLIMLLFSLYENHENRIKRKSNPLSDTDELSEGEVKKEKKRQSLCKRLLSPITNAIKIIFKLKLSSYKESKIEVRLVQAGSPFGMSPLDFRLLQILLVFIIPTLSGILAKVSGADTLSIVLIVAVSIVFSITIPNYYLHMKSKQRSMSALKELPDVVDLLTVSLEAGLGFDSALGKVIAKKNGILAGEFHRCLEEIRLGKTRRDSLKGIQERLLLDELHSLISSILQAEKLGISMVHILRIQSHEIRQKRKQRAEEAAMKAPIKMLFPLVLFIFPSLFIVLLGPALIQFLSIQ